jgi:hypothetical protein
MKDPKSDNPLYTPIIFPLIATGNVELQIAEGFIDIYKNLYISKGIMYLRKEAGAIYDLMDRDKEVYGAGKDLKNYETYIKMKESDDPVVNANSEKFRSMAIRKSPMYLTRLGILTNLHLQHNHWGKLNKKSLMEFIGGEPTKVTKTMIDIIHFINEFTDNPDNEYLTFTTTVDSNDCMLDWMSRNLDLGTGQGSVRDRIMNTIKFIRENMENDLDNESVTNTKWYFKNKDAILEAMMTIHFNVISGNLKYVNK